MSHSFKKIIALATIASFMSFSGVASALGTNGSFELGTDPGSFTTINTGDSTSITDWTVSVGSVDYIGSYWQSSNGSRNIDLNALVAGTVQQTVPTTIGATYKVTFDLSGNPDSVGDPQNPWYSPSLKTVRVAATGASSQDFSYDTAVEMNDKSTMKWKPQTYTFVATAANTDLSFASQTPGAFGPAIDNVVITEEAPACVPGTLTLTSGTNTQFKGMTTVDPAGSSADGLFTGGTAPAVVAGPDGFPGAWDTAGLNPAVSGANWVNNTSVAPGNPATAGGDGTIDTWRLFSQSFTLPAGAVVSSATVSFSADNSANAYYDNASIGSVADFQTVTTVPFGATPGSHELEFVTKNFAYDGVTNPTAVIYKAQVSYTCPVVEPVHPKVVIAKYIDGVHATAGNADSAAFPMTTTWTSSGPNGNVTDAHFTLSPAPWGGIGDPYEATYINGVAGDNYATNEITNDNNPVVGANCAAGKPFALVGYTTGDSFAAAAAQQPSATIPSFTDLQSDKYVIVWNTKCPVLGSVSGMKFWDVNGNGVKNAGEPGLSGWTFQLSGPTPGSQVTAAGGTYTFGGLAAGAYTMNEVMQAGWTRTTPLPAFTLAAGENKTGVNIGNACFVPTGGKGKGYWTNKNGEATMKDGNSFTSELNELTALNLRNANGSAFDPATYAAYSAWNSSANATNMAYMLSAQLSALYLSREAGFINGSKQIVITDPALASIPGMSPLGVITINDLITAANTELGLHANTTTPNPYRAYQEALKNAVEKATEGTIQLCMPFNPNA